MKKLILAVFLTGILIFSLAGAAGAALIAVSQGGTTLGYIQPYTGTEDAVTNYADHLVTPPNGPARSDYEGQVYFYQNDDGLYLNMHFGTGTDDSASQTMVWHINITDTNDLEVTYSDDPPANGYNAELREYSDNYFEGHWTWLASVGDGGVIGKLSDGGWSITINQSYTEPMTMTSLYAYSGDGAQITLNTSDDIVLAPVPIPGALWLLGSGLLGLFTVRRRQRS